MMCPMCCDDRNLDSVSDGKGGPLSVKNHFDCPYWDISSCSFCMMKSVVFDDVL